jgi:hypothetical protein
MVDFVKHIQSLLADPSYHDAKKSTLLTRVQAFRDDTKQRGMLGRVFDGLPYHDESRSKQLYQQFKLAVIELNTTDEKNPASIQMLRFVNEIMLDACRDVLDGAGNLKKELVELLKLNELPAWKDENERKNITRFIINAYVSDYTTGRFGTMYGAELQKLSTANPKASANNDKLFRSGLEVAGKIQGLLSTKEMQDFDERIIKGRGDTIIVSNLSPKRSSITTLTKALREYWNNNHANMTESDFKLVCLLVEVVSSLRDEYQDKKELSVFGKKLREVSGVKDAALKRLEDQLIHHLTLNPPAAISEMYKVMNIFLDAEQQKLLAVNKKGTLISKLGAAKIKLISIISGENHLATTPKNTLPAYEIKLNQVYFAYLHHHYASLIEPQLRVLNRIVLDVKQILLLCDVKGLSEKVIEFFSSTKRINNDNIMILVGEINALISSRVIPQKELHDVSHKINQLQASVTLSLNDLVGVAPKLSTALIAAKLSPLEEFRGELDKIRHVYLREAGTMNSIRERISDEKDLGRFYGNVVAELEDYLTKIPRGGAANNELRTHVISLLTKYEILLDNSKKPGAAVDLKATAAAPAAGIAIDVVQVDSKVVDAAVVNFSPKK